MSRKPKKGYFVRGQFVAEGSELDLEFKRELKGTSDATRTDLKRASTELQKLGEDLLTLRTDLMARLDLSEKLVDAVAEAKRITNFEGKRRQMQYIGKLMRSVEVEPIREALSLVRGESASETAKLHRIERLRTEFLDDEKVLHEIATQYPGIDLQHLRSLRRSALKEREQNKPPRSYRAIFQLFKELEQINDAPAESNNGTQET